jgi:hypothetical protein
LNAYIARPGKKYFVNEANLPPTPHPQHLQRPNTAESTRSSAKKKRRPNTPKTPQSDYEGKSTKEKIAYLKEKIEHQVQSQRGMEKKIAQQASALKRLESQIKAANGVEAAIQHNIDQLEALGVYEFKPSWKPAKEEMFYDLGSNKVGVINVFKDCGVVFISELLSGVKYEGAVELDLDDADSADGNV